MGWLSKVNKIKLMKKKHYLSLVFLISLQQPRLKSLWTSMWKHLVYRNGLHFPTPRRVCSLLQPDLCPLRSTEVALSKLLKESYIAKSNHFLSFLLPPHLCSISEWASPAFSKLSSSWPAKQITIPQTHLAHPGS